METQTLQAEVREGRGKGSARQLRMQGKIPAVFYGPGTDTKALSVSPKALLKALDTDFGRNTVLSLEFDGASEQAIVKDIQVHPVERRPLHVDFYRVSEDRPIEIQVPMVATGRSLGEQKGGRTYIIFRDLPVRTTPGLIPAKIEIVVDELDMGDVVSVSDLKLPEGVSVLFPPDRRLVVVGEDRRRDLEAEEAEAAAAALAAEEAAAPTEGAEGAPEATPTETK